MKPVKEFKVYFYVVCIGMILQIHAAHAGAESVDQACTTNLENLSKENEVQAHTTVRTWNSTTSSLPEGGLSAVYGGASVKEVLTAYEGTLPDKLISGATYEKVETINSDLSRGPMKNIIRGLHFPNTPAASQGDVERTISYNPSTDQGRIQLHMTSGPLKGSSFNVEVNPGPRGAHAHWDLSSIRPWSKNPQGNPGPYSQIHAAMHIPSQMALKAGEAFSTMAAPFSPVMGALISAFSQIPEHLWKKGEITVSTALARKITGDIKDGPLAIAAQIDANRTSRNGGDTDRIVDRKDDASRTHASYEPEIAPKRPQESHRQQHIRIRQGSRLPSAFAFYDDDGRIPGSVTVAFVSEKDRSRLQVSAAEVDLSGEKFESSFNKEQVIDTLWRADFSWWLTVGRKGFSDGVPRKAYFDLPVKDPLSAATPLKWGKSVIAPIVAPVWTFEGQSSRQSWDGCRFSTQVLLPEKGLVLEFASVISEILFAHIYEPREHNRLHDIIAEPNDLADTRKRVLNILNDNKRLFSIYLADDKDLEDAHLGKSLSYKERIKVWEYGARDRSEAPIVWVEGTN